MIKNIYQNICEALGSNYQVFFFEKALSLSDDEKKQYKNKTIGVFYVSNADYSPLKDNPGLQGHGVLYLYVPVKTNFDATLYAFESLVNDTNGKIIDDGTTYDYVLNWQYPTPVGSVENDYGAMRQMYAMSFSFVVSSNNLYGDGLTVTVNGQELTGITLWNYQSQKATYNKVDLDSFRATNILQNSNFSLALECLVQNTAIWGQIQTNALLQVDTQYEVVISFASGVNRTATCVLSDYTQTGARGQFQVARLTFVDTGLGATSYVTVAFDGNGGAWADPDKYTLTYNANGGTGSVVDSNSPYDANVITVVKAGTGLTRSGYSFVGWNTQANGLGTTYYAGNNITITTNITLYAMWGALITFNGNGGQWQ